MVTGDGSDQGEVKSRRYGCNKNDFLPEESFKSWGNYGRALRDTKSRLKNRLFTRSSDELELHEMRARSQNEMKRTLNWFDIIWFGVGSVLGAGVFVLTGQAAREHSGPAVIISYLISGGASVARSWTSYFATLCNHKPDDFRIHASFLANGFNQLDPIAVLLSIAICIGASLSIKGSSRFNSLITMVNISVMIFILIAGLTKADTSNFQPFVPFGIDGVLRASAMLFFAYVGFDGVSTLGEEIKNPGIDIPIGLIGSMVIIITIYCLLGATLCLMQPYTQIDVDAPFTIAFKAVGMNWAKYVVAIGALKGMTTVLLANIIGQARYFTHIARTHMAPPFLAVINEKTKTPVNATVIMTIANCIVALFTSLGILANLLSISTLFIFSLVSFALIVRRYYVSGETTNSDRNKLIGFLTMIVMSSLGLALVWVFIKNVVGYIVFGTLWFIATLGLKLTVKEAKKPKLWGVPFMPWLPSASVAINVFIMGSIDGPSFIRFSIWTAGLLVYYLFVGLHASYDAAKETREKIDVEQVEAATKYQSYE
ncbi:Cationic amino acid transporter 1 [Heracleum sosnowskyi]|uniref:Cationic amino acid transporter 1 n=1 Tax=Heracleum sosnowskyi TaxID=360622 RepID=A0AAD8MB81_9APIA|nr:Cationic amino acid transporter 1 [Heracleum sosnowskyi]